jgi:hypothetical protein
MSGSKNRRLRLCASSLAVVAVGAFAVAAGNGASTAPSRLAAAAGYSFQTLGDPADPTFNQLLGVNDAGLIVGYYGSGANAKHPNKGYTLSSASSGTYTAENYPGSVQTQVTAVTSSGNTAGFWVDAQGNNHGFIDWNGVFTTVDDPAAAGKTKTTQILGLNAAGVAVGFYNDGQGNAHAFKYNQNTRVFTALTPPNASTAVATAINMKDEIAGFLTRGKTTAGFFVSHATYDEFDVPNSTNTQAFGVNADEEIVGSYLDAHGQTHGFVLTNPTTHAAFKTVDDPAGVGSTVINGVNDKGQLVGFYQDSAKNTVGFFATP